MKLISLIIFRAFHNFSIYIYIPTDKMFTTLYFLQLKSAIFLTQTHGNNLHVTMTTFLLMMMMMVCMYMYMYTLIKSTIYFLFRICIRERKQYKWWWWYRVWVFIHTCMGKPSILTQKEIPNIPSIVFWKVCAFSRVFFFFAPISIQWIQKSLLNTSLVCGVSSIVPTTFKYMKNARILTHFFFFDNICWLWRLTYTYPRSYKIQIKNAIDCFDVRQSCRVTSHIMKSIFYSIEF